MIYHVLPGDAQVESFKQSGIEGEILVCREALVEGDLSGATLEEFFQHRAAFINGSYDEDPALYNANVASQFRKLTELNDEDEVNLWFEYELFCAANMWFCTDLLSKTGASVFRVEPVYLSKDNRWDGFGKATPELMLECFAARTELMDDEITLGSELWNAFRVNDRASLERLSNEVSPAFPYLKDVCDAALAKDFLPQETIKQIQSEGITDFNKLFPEFKRRAGVYGFGDSQVKRIMESVRE